MSQYRIDPQMGLNFTGELLVDNFAGGGGASTGIEMALGRPVDIAINHDPEAIELHTVNHPHTLHLCESVWDVDPRQAAGGRPVALAWFSPDCRHFSKAKGGKPVSPRVRGLAWVAVRWAATVGPRVIVLENVEEFTTWGPVVKDREGNYTPCQKRRGRTFRSFTNALARLGYAVDYRELRACDYGAPTSRKRFFMVARRDGQPIVWPEPTHGPGRQPYRTAAEIIDWSIPVPSIFGRDRPLADATLARIANGLRRFVMEADDPYMAPGRPAANDNRPQVAAFLAKHYGGVIGHVLRQPIGTITTKDHHSLVTVKFGHGQPADVRAFLVAYYGSDKDGQSLDVPVRTIPTRDRFGLVTVHGRRSDIVDIGMRMLAPRELYTGQGFPRDYVIDRNERGEPITKTAQTRMVGNSVSPVLACAIVRANLVPVAANDNRQQAEERRA